MAAQDLVGKIEKAKRHVMKTMNIFKTKAGDISGLDNNVKRAKDQLIKLACAYEKLDSLECEEDGDKWMAIVDEATDFYAELDRLQRRFKRTSSSEESPAPLSNMDAFPLTMLPKLSCPVFSGNERDNFAFKNFLT